MGRLRLIGVLVAAVACAGPAPAQDKAKLIPLDNLPWRRPILLDKETILGTVEVDKGKEAKVLIDKALAARGEAAVVPGFRPLAVGDILVYRSFNDLRAIYLKEVKGPPAFKPGDIHFKSTYSEGGLAILLDSPDYLVDLNQWLNSFGAADRAHILLENSLNGTASHDGQRVYWVDDLCVPPPAGIDEKRIPERLKTLHGQNLLWATDVETGKIVWRLPVGLGEDGKDPFVRSHFLGPPLPLGGKLYVLNENNKGELRLVVLEPATGKVDGIHILDTVDPMQRFIITARRRLSAVQLVESGGVLICCPNAGKIYAVDAGKHKVLWSQNYRKDPPPPTALAYWKQPAPFVHDGKIIFTAADDELVHCRDLKDGKELWKAKPASDLTVGGVVGDSVMLIGQFGCRALTLAEGKPRWKLELGPPAGLGVFRKTTYLLPLKKGTATNQPEIASIDAEQGKLIGTSPVKEIPGNLLLAGDRIFSQSVGEITGFMPGKQK
jgi:outer membrane protein assembly factor BamB